MALNPTYSVGTVSVSAGASIVTGSGTQFVAAGIRAGDVFERAGLTLTIAGVDSATQLTLVKPWPGGSVSVGSYEVRYTPDASRVMGASRQLIEDLSSGNLPALSGVPSAGDTVPFFTGPGAAGVTPLTSLARELLAQGTPQAFREALGLVGYAGAGIRVLGTFNSTGDLPVTATIGDAYLIGTNIHIWDGAEWQNAGPVAGPPGSDGVQIYATRAAAVSAAPGLSASVTQMFNRAGTTLEVRSRTAYADDPLFETGDRWGVVQRQDADRSKHTGTQPMNTVSGLPDALDGLAQAQADGVAALSAQLGDETAARVAAISETAEAQQAALHEQNYRQNLDQFIGTGPEGITPPATVSEDNRVLTILVGGAETSLELLEQNYRDHLDEFVGTGAPGVAIPVFVSEDNIVLDVVGRSAMPPSPESPRIIEVVAGYGQSNERGQTGATRSLVYGAEPKPGILTLLRDAAADVWLGLTGQSARLLSGNITGIGPLVPGFDVSNTHGTVPVEGFARKWQQLREVRTGTVADVLIYTLAQGGQSIDALVPGTAISNRYGYENLVTGLQSAHDNRPEGAQVRARVIPMCQGEADTSNSALGALHDSIRAQYQIDAQGITGQTDAMRMISWQPSSFQSVSTGVRSILQYALDNAGDGLFFCGGPTYPFAFSDDYLHQESIGHARRGEMNAAIADIVLSTGVYVPLHMTGAIVTGANQITVSLSEPAAVETNAVVAAIDHLGITLVGGEVSDISVSGANIVITTIAAASAVTAVQSGLVGQVSPRTAARIPRTNIRSVASIGAFLTGAPMRKWLCHDQITIG